MSFSGAPFWQWLKISNSSVSTYLLRVPTHVVEESLHRQSPGRK
ncbi:hypothetical protein [Mesorhizobium sp. M0664]